MLPQLIYLTLIVMSFTIHLVKHGEEQPTYNVFTSGIATILALALLYWGGFFDKFIEVMIK